MPLFEFNCEMCGHSEEDLYRSKKHAEATPAKCPNCDDLMTLVFPRPSVHDSVDMSDFFNPKRVDARRKECGVEV